MITDWLLDLLHSAITKVFAAIAAHLPAPPGWLLDAVGFIHTVMGYVGAFDSWVPLSIALPITVFVGVALVAGLVIKVVRIVLSFATLGGGSAA